MSANQFGKYFRMTSFGESHGPAMGVVLDGVPSGIDFDFDLIQKELDRRRPGSNKRAAQGVVSDRNESDQVQVLSGVYQGKTLGTPIAMMVFNEDTRSQDYDEITKNHRTGHADSTWAAKFAAVDLRGGGRSSGRETVSRVMAGSVAQMFVKALYPTCAVLGFSDKIGPIELTSEELRDIQQGLYFPDDYTARFPSPRHGQVRDLLWRAKHEGKSYGGAAQIWIQNPPANLGQPVFHKLKGDIAGAMLSVGATCSFELGDGILATDTEGTQFHRTDSRIQYGGIQGGISNGETIICRVGFKPTASVLDVAKKGRHDPCIVPRAIPVLESMMWLILADHILWSRSDRI